MRRIELDFPPGYSTGGFRKRLRSQDVTVNGAVCAHPQSLQKHLSRRTVLAYLGKYTTPSDLLQDESLTVEEKIGMLESWRDDKEAYMRASEEGMQGSSRSEFLRLIENALISLREKPSTR